MHLQDVAEQMIRKTGKKLLIIADKSVSIRRKAISGEVLNVLLTARQANLHTIVGNTQQWGCGGAAAREAIASPLHFAVVDSI